VDTASLGLRDLALVYRGVADQLSQGENNLGWTGGSATAGPWFVYLKATNTGQEAAVVTIGRALGATHSAIDNGAGGHDVEPGDPWWLKRFFVDGHEYNVVAIKIVPADMMNPGDEDYEFKYITIRTPVSKVDFVNTQDSQNLQGYGIGDTISVMPPFNFRHTRLEDIQRLQEGEFADLSFYADGCAGDVEANVDPLLIEIVDEDRDEQLFGELKEKYWEREDEVIEEIWVTEQFHIVPDRYTDLALPAGQLYLLTSDWQSDQSWLHFYGCHPADGTLTQDQLSAWHPDIPATNAVLPGLRPFFAADEASPLRVKFWYDPEGDDDLYKNTREVTPTPTPTNTSTPTNTPTPTDTPTPTPTNTSTPTNTPTSTNTPTPTPTPTDTPTPTNTPTSTPTFTPTPTSTPTHTPTPTDTPTPTPTPTDTPTPTNTPTPTPTPTNTPTFTPTPTNTPTRTPTSTPTNTPTPTPVVSCYYSSPEDSIYRVDPSDFSGYTTISAADSPLIRVSSPPAPSGWNQPSFVPDSSWQPGAEVWWQLWEDPHWTPLPPDSAPIGLWTDGDPEGLNGTTYLYRRALTLSPPRSCMQVVGASLEMWSDNKTEWWWQGASVMYNQQGYIGPIELFPAHVGLYGGDYLLAIQNSNDYVCPREDDDDCNPHGTAWRLCVTWRVAGPCQPVYLPLVRKP
jgi:hypothetical protein